MKTPLQVTQFSIPPGYIDLGLGDPQFSLLPQDLLRQAAKERLGQNDSAFLQYGAERGDGTFLQSLAKFLSRGYLYPVEPDSLFITNGASMGLHLICTLFTKPGDTVFVEEPTYFLALRIFADHELRLVPIRTDENGLVIEHLEEKLAEARPKFLYIIPTYQNPTGHTLPLDRRQRLVSLSSQYDFLVVADEVYHFLGYSGQTPRPFAAETGVGKVISVGSFSKILAPGLRLGWIQADEKIIHRFINCGLLDSGGGMNPFTSAIVCQVLETGGLERNISKLVDIYRSRVAVMDAMLHKYLPDGEYVLPKGGYFFWIRLPNRINSTDLQNRAEDFKVGFRPGTLFSCQGGMQEYIRLSYVFYEPDDLEQGVLRLKRSLETMKY
ncbi:MAG TPA: PLP-dependent aminotransferase family protein [Anaerolineales bacterium]